MSPLVCSVCHQHCFTSLWSMWPPPAAITCHHQSHTLPSDLAIRQISLNWYCPSSLISIFIVSFNTTQRLQFPLIRSVVDSPAHGVSDPRSDIISERDCLASTCSGDLAPQAGSSSAPKVSSRFVPSWFRSHLLPVPAAGDRMLLR